ncbi:MAG: zinc ribbon domain-containing protein [Solirubrobacteraceae bacterium]|jgi:RNA polymerase subunit RPABC4/transcription elongation factor Spt4
MRVPFAYFGISSSGVNLFINLVLLFAAILWLSLIYWTRADAKRRLDDPLLVLCATAASVFPFVGTLIYMIVRPPEYLEDARERELEMQAAEARIAQASVLACPYCHEEIEKDFLLCPNCQSRLRDPCPRCHRALELTWSVCPYCETHVGGSVSHRHRETYASELPPA